jgi:hypothetical protein
VCVCVCLYIYIYIGLIAIFCDGSYELDINSTVWVVQETLIESNVQSVMYNRTLVGSHHGVAIPVDDTHLLHSLATPDRINKTDIIGEEEALPSTFEVIKYPDGTILHTFHNTSSIHTSCSGFHGEWAHHDQIALACDEDHGGILRVDYDADDADLEAGTYTSRALEYPSTYPNHRTGSFIGHDSAEYVVGGFTSFEDGIYHLMAFHPNDVQLTESNILSLPDLQCDFSFEMGTANDVVVFFPDGHLEVLEYHQTAEGDASAGWYQKASLQVVPDMVDCSEVVVATGVAQTFVLSITTQQLYVVELVPLLDAATDSSDGVTVDPEAEGIIVVSSLDFIPLDAIVAGAPASVACSMEASAGHDHADHDDQEGETDVVEGTPAPEGTDTSSSSSIGWLSRLCVAVAAMSFIAIFH